MDYPELILLNIGHAEQNADWNWKDVSSPFARIFLPTSGAATLHIGDDATDLHPGRIYFIPPFVTHSYECHGPFSLYYLHVYERPGRDVSQSVFDRYSFVTEISDVPGCIEAGLAELCKSFPDLRLHNSDPGEYDTHMQFVDYLRRFDLMPMSSRMQMQGVMLQILSAVIRHAVLRPWALDSRMSKIANVIASRIGENIPVKELASIANISLDHFTRTFKSCFGLTPLQYINRKRIERACNILVNNQYTVKEVAFSIGFDDPAYFIRLFKKFTGTTPQRYRHSAM